MCSHSVECLFIYLFIFYIVEEMIKNAVGVSLQIAVCQWKNPIEFGADSSLLPFLLHQICFPFRIKITVVWQRAIF